MDIAIEKTIIEKIIAICDESIDEGQISEELGCSRVPIGRSDTYMIRNTLCSVLDTNQNNSEKIKEKA